jgi:Phage integrase, N-terminal SAM-like domain
VEYCTRAADRAFALLAYHEAAYRGAVGHYQRALQALDLQSPSEHARRAELLLALGRAQTAAADPSTARATYEQAAASARKVSAAEPLAQAALGLGVEFVAGLRSFERHLRAENRSEHTIASYLESLRQAEAFLAGRGRSLVDARREDLEAFLGELLQRRAPETVATRYRRLRGLYRCWRRKRRSPPAPWRE